MLDYCRDTASAPQKGSEEGKETETTSVRNHRCELPTLADRFCLIHPAVSIAMAISMPVEGSGTAVSPVSIV